MAGKGEGRWRMGKDLRKCGNDVIFCYSLGQVIITFLYFALSITYSLASMVLSATMLHLHGAISRRSGTEVVQLQVCRERTPPLPN